jgi:hypothetical protein
MIIFRGAPAIMNVGRAFSTPVEPGMDASDRLKRKQIREREKIQKRKPNRVTYDLPPRIKEAVRELAEEQRVPASQLVAIALARFLRDVEKGELDLARFKQPSQSPRYDWNLVLPASWIPRRRREAKKSSDSKSG